MDTTTTKCHKCRTVLQSWEGVDCHGYDLCDSCYEDHTPRVSTSDDDGSDEPLND